MQLSVGPVAITGLLTAAGAKNLSPQTTEEYIQAAIVLGFVSGAYLLILGLLRFGFVVDFLSNTVLSGFISASACIIFASQLKDILGLNEHGEDFISDLAAVFKNLKETNGYAVLGSLFCLALLFGIKQVKKVPKWVSVELLLMLVAILISWAAKLDLLIKTVGIVPSGFPPITIPNLALFPMSNVLLQALIIALISYIGSIALARGFAFKHGAEIDANQELIALGAAGVVGAFFSGHPVSGSFSR
jgi:SulP family sulfate permease